jgi:hypothetical protein
VTRLARPALGIVTAAWAAYAIVVVSDTGGGAQRPGDPLWAHGIDDDPGLLGKR